MYAAKKLWEERLEDTAKPFSESLILKQSFEELIILCSISRACVLEE